MHVAAAVNQITVEPFPLSARKDGRQIENFPVGCLSSVSLDLKAGLRALSLSV